MGRTSSTTFARSVGLAVAFPVALAIGAGRVSAQNAARTDSTGTVVGIVTMKDAGVPLGYSVASVPALARERFSNDQGVFVLAQLPIGVVQLRVRHLGYSPANVSVTVRAGQVDTVRVQLARIAVQLSAVHVHAAAECKNPGLPSAVSDSAFAVVFDQLRQNAEQYRLLTAEYPFVFSMERTMISALVSGESRLVQIDTVSSASRNSWVYEPGRVVTRVQTPNARSSLGMNIPTLVDFADETFINNHCFYNGGLESIDGAQLLRVDFVAASRIADPDVNGSMYLDPTSFQIRRSILHLSKIPRGLVGLRDVEATTYFRDVLPSISVVAGILSVNVFDVRPRSADDTISEDHEEQRLLQVHFLRGMPGDDTKKPQQ